MDKTREIPNSMNPNDPRFPEWVQMLLDQDDEGTKFEESDEDLEDTAEIEQINEENSDTDYSTQQNSDDGSSDGEPELSNDEDNFYFGKNGFKWLCTV